jgi:TolB protein
MARIIVCLLSLSLLLPVLADEAAPAERAGNPTLKLRSWQGSPDVQARLQQDLLYSDWFALADGETADYYLDGVVGQEGQETTLALTLVRGQEKKEVRQKDANPTWLAHRAADLLIKAAFGNDGFCATQLALVKADDQTKEIWVSDFDGSNAQPITHNRSLSTEPAWGGRNRYLSYTLYRQASTDIVILDLVEKKHKILASYQGLNAGCALAHHSLLAAMSLSKDGKQVDLFVKDIRTDKLLPLTADDAVEASPCWSPDDRYLCFVSNRQQRPALFVVPAAGGEAKPLAAAVAEAASPDWSPVSNQLCFAMHTGQSDVIAELDMSATTSAVKVLTNAAGDWEAPSWCADGRHLVCSRTFDGHTTLYLVDSRYGKLRELKTGEGFSLPACSFRY